MPFNATGHVPHPDLETMMDCLKSQTTVPPCLLFPWVWQRRVFANDSSPRRAFLYASRTNFHRCTSSVLLAVISGDSAFHLWSTPFLLHAHTHTGAHTHLFAARHVSFPFLLLLKDFCVCLCFYRKMPVLEACACNLRLALPSNNSSLLPGVTIHITETRTLLNYL